VADGVEDYYVGAGEAPGVWRGGWASELGLEGVVAADDLRALVDGRDPGSGRDLLVGVRERTVRAFDVTMSAPKSVSLLWAFGTPETSAAVSIAVVEATEEALAFLEERAAVARRQDGGVRRRVSTAGFAVATFAHRTSRAGDPQLHAHCVVPNLVRRYDAKHVALDANPLHEWAKAAGTIFQNELQRRLSDQLGVRWGPERNGCREMVGFTTEQLRAFSKRTVAIETHLEAVGEVVFDSPRQRMAAIDRASTVTRADKDMRLTPEVLRRRWNHEAIEVGLAPGVGVDAMVIDREARPILAVDDEMLFAGLCDPDTGLCATAATFGEAHVVERIAALSGGRLSTDEVMAATRRFLHSDLIVRLAPGIDGRRPPQWSTVELRTVEDRLLAHLADARGHSSPGIGPGHIDDALSADSIELGPDQAEAVRTLCGAGPDVRALVAPAGYGKTTAVRAAVHAQLDAGRRVIALAPTHKATAELRTAGIDAQTIARFLRHRSEQPLDPNTTVVVDEVSQIGTRPAARLVESVAAAGAQLWFIGDARQAQSVAAGGLAVELERLAERGEIAAATLTVNRRQDHPEDRTALTLLRSGDVVSSAAVRTEHGWSHECNSNIATREAMAEALVVDADRHGADQVAGLAESHADCEDLADRVRQIKTRRGELRGPTLSGPGWGPVERRYAAGDRILVHTTIGASPTPDVFNGSTGTIVELSERGASVRLDDGHEVFVSAGVFAGVRPDQTPNVSHAWVRTVDGAQGGTWTQAHLLGTPALDRLTGYVGLSRSRQPTHTWNTRPDVDHPLSLLADGRTPTEMVTDAMKRFEPKTLAATEDPWHIDRQLRAQRAAHDTVIAARPPDRHGELLSAQRQLQHAERDLDRASGWLEACESRRRQLGPLARLRPSGRRDLSDAEMAVARACDHLHGAESTAARARAKVNSLEAAQAACERWSTDNRWRFDAVRDIDDQLCHHWADVALRCARADDPLAFGVDNLRGARMLYAAELRDLEQSLPPDRRAALQRAQVLLDSRQHDVDRADRTARDAEVALREARQRRWGRHDKPAITAAERQRDEARRGLRTAVDSVRDARADVGTERVAVQRWTEATDASAGRRQDLATATDDLQDALIRTRGQRLQDAVNDPSHELWSVVGPPPMDPGGLTAWYGIADAYEAWIDHRPPNNVRVDRLLGEPTHPNLGLRPSNARDQWNRVATLVDHHEEIISMARELNPTRDAKATDLDSCRHTVDAVVEILSRTEPHPQVERDGLGLSL
jgi:conjugative relaxase-like TrwC/TraI family protein